MCICSPEYLYKTNHSSVLTITSTTLWGINSERDKYIATYSYSYGKLFRNKMNELQYHKWILQIECMEQLHFHRVQKTSQTKLYCLETYTYVVKKKNKHVIPIKFRIIVTSRDRKGHVIWKDSCMGEGLLLGCQLSSIFLIWMVVKWMFTLALVLVPYVYILCTFICVTFYN